MTTKITFITQVGRRGKEETEYNIETIAFSDEVVEKYYLPEYLGRAYMDGELSLNEDYEWIDGQSLTIDNEVGMMINTDSYILEQVKEWAYITIEPTVLVY